MQLINTIKETKEKVPALKASDRIDVVNKLKRFINNNQQISQADIERVLKHKPGTLSQYVNGFNLPTSKKYLDIKTFLELPHELQLQKCLATKKPRKVRDEKYVTREEFNEVKAKLDKLLAELI
jgi:hypothetical protein